MSVESSEVRPCANAAEASRDCSANKDTNQAGTNHSAAERTCSNQHENVCRPLTALVRNRVIHSLLSKSVRNSHDRSERNRFVPIGVLKDVLDPEAVKEVLESFLGADNVVDIAEYVCPSRELESGELGARRILAALLIMGDENRICKFKERGITDDLIRQRNDNFTEILEETGPDYDGQKRTPLDLFYDAYWQFMSPFLKKLPRPTHLQSSAAALKLDEHQATVTLPWTYRKRLSQASSTPWSTVWKVKIHADHHDLVSLTVQRRRPWSQMVSWRQLIDIPPLRVTTGTNSLY
jgi:hypothetical protein